MYDKDLYKLTILTIIMKIKEIKDNYHFENLTEEHDLSEFDCGDEDLNDFLKTDALKQQESRLNVTKLIMCEDEIIGYVSLLTDTLVLKNINDENLKEKIKGELNIKSKNREISAVKIGRLALDKKYIGEGLGTHILMNVLGNLKRISEKDIGFRFIIVEGYAKAFNFYVIKNEFQHLNKDCDKIKNIDFISKRDPTKKFYLYFDLEKY